MPEKIDRLSKPIPKLYEDAHCVVFNKPAGLLVIPSPRQQENTLIQIVNAQYADPSFGRLHPCHRLDRDTSGVILFAKGKSMQRRLMDLFHKQAVKKKYTAFVQGKLPQARGRMSRPILTLESRRFRKFSKRRSRKREGEPCFAAAPAYRMGRKSSRLRRPRPEGLGPEGGEPAVTDYKVLEQRKFFSIVEVEPVTGRTNQIRIHFSQTGHPLVGERKYALGRDAVVKFKRTALHAAEIAWPHPETGKTIRVQAPMPEDLKRFLEKTK